MNKKVIVLCQVMSCCVIVGSAKPKCGSLSCCLVSAKQGRRKGGGNQERFSGPLGLGGPKTLVNGGPVLKKTVQQPHNGGVTFAF